MAESPDKPEFLQGQRVRVRVNERNKTAHVGIVRQLIWHHKDRRFNYYLEEDGKRISKRYFAEDLEKIG